MMTLTKKQQQTRDAGLAKLESLLTQYQAESDPMLLGDLADAIHALWGYDLMSDEERAEWRARIARARPPGMAGVRYVEYRPLGTFGRHYSWMVGDIEVDGEIRHVHWVSDNSKGSRNNRVSDFYDDGQVCTAKGEELRKSRLKSSATRKTACKRSQP